MLRAEIEWMAPRQFAANYMHTWPPLTAACSLQIRACGILLVFEVGRDQETLYRLHESTVQCAPVRMYATVRSVRLHSVSGTVRTFTLAQ
jgi:hypothetical protein